MRSETFMNVEGFEEVFLLRREEKMKYNNEHY